MLPVRRMNHGGYPNLTLAYRLARRTTSVQGHRARWVGWRGPSITRHHRYRRGGRRLCLELADLGAQGSKLIGALRARLPRPIACRQHKYKANTTTARETNCTAMFDYSPQYK